ncbi:T9SS type A sorting domain-containing protein [Hymenobacter sp. DH14]|uniref:T9SS type A sorting domain-containing protein n=1 Tax=Hymenobacter cyanobacteriorum TaxID=2926463 RepID=A0A9X1VFN1_9BACT|nr:T9SS type A sorting domain-containing protein [Hymenobacter cyanobacteriorum]MCI1187887.1 T9SS type A sorting domain-containing protein [Hymenobacter cyanobacteriorum]
MLVYLLLLAGPAKCGGLDAILNPDGTVRTGAVGSFNAKGYTIETTPDGRPSFRVRPSQQRFSGNNNRFLRPASVTNGVDGVVLAIAIASNGTLYAGGYFSRAGGVAVNNIAQWNGTNWAPLDSGVSGSQNALQTFVSALAITNAGILYVGGNFTTAGGVTATGIAQWNGTSWAPLGAGVSWRVSALALSGGTLYVGGTFTTAGGVAANNVATWNGGGWAALGDGINSHVYGVAPSGGSLYVGGEFTRAAQTKAYRLAKWNGTRWDSLNTGINLAVGVVVKAMAVSSTGTVYAGGNFTTAGGVTVNGIARWTGTNWAPLGSGVNGAGTGGSVDVITISSSGMLYAGGYFSTIGGVAANHIAQWNGTSWAPLGAGMDGRVQSLALSSDGTLYAGGAFTTADGVSTIGIARWDGAVWNALDEVPRLTAFHLRQPGVVTSRTDLHYQPSSSVKVGADNAAGTLFSVARGAGQNTLSLRIRENANNNATGPLADAAGYCGQVTTTATAVEAVYHHPAFVDDPGPYKTLHLELVDVANPAVPVVISTYLVRVVRPPLLLVHGLFSNGQTAFPGLINRLVGDHVYEQEGDIRYAVYDNDREFSHNAQYIIYDKEALLSAYSDRNISVSKIDVVGHSMGGLLARQYIQSGVYRQDVNKLITLNTPHSGTPIPNFINSLSPLPRGAIALGLRFLIGDIDAGAVNDLSYNGSAMGRLNTAPNLQGVALHTITTHTFLGAAPDLQQLLNGRYSWPGYIAGWMGLLHPRLSLNTYLNDSVYQDRHDLAVGVNSQNGGLSGLYTSSNIPNQTHFSGSNPVVHTRIKELLKANPNGTPNTSTTPFTKAGVSPRPVYSVYTRPISVSSIKTASTLQITAPTRSTIVTDVDSISVTVAGSSDVTKIMLVCGVGTPVVETRLINGAGGTVFIKVPKGGLGRLKVAAFAFAGSAYVQFDTLSTGLTTTATLTGLRLAPRLFYTTPGDSAILEVTGTYSDGIDRNVLGQPGMQFAFKISGKARMGRSKHHVVGLALGRDSLRVTYGGRTDIVPIEVAARQTPTLSSRAPMASQQIAMWPNPAQQSVQISGAGGLPIALFDMLGRVVRTYASLKPSEVVTMDLRGLPSGVYIVRMGSVTRRLLVE